MTPYYIIADLLATFSITIQTVSTMSMATLEVGSVHEASPKVSEGVKSPREHPFYFEDPQYVVLKVENRIYRIHRYFLVQESDFFRDMFSLPQGDFARVEGADEMHPICIPDTTIVEFENLLRFFYFGMHCDYRPTIVDWTAILSISTRLDFPKVHERVIKELTSRLEEINRFDLIALAVKYDVQQWFKPAYRRIVLNVELISCADAEKIPFRMAVMLMRSRERYWKRPVFNSLDDIIEAETKIMDL